jgi:hypothetical protein
MAGAALIGFLIGPCPESRASNFGPEPIYWRQREFFIPYQAPALDPNGAVAAKVRLSVARDGGEWVVLQEAAPNVRGFGYHAPADGEYAFAVEAVDPRQAIAPAGAPQPQLRVIVDTQPPALQLTASVDLNGLVVVRYEAHDRNLRAETLRIEAQVGESPREPLALGPPDVSYPDRLLGQIVWKPPLPSSRIQVHGTISDRAGNSATATTHPGTGAAPGLVGAAVNSTAGAPPAPADAGSTAPVMKPVVDWPSNNTAGGDAEAAQPGVADRRSTVPPLENPYTTPNEPTSTPAAPRGTPARLTADHGGATGSAGLGASPLAPPLLNNSADSLPLSPFDDWRSAGPIGDSPAPPAADQVQWVKSLTVDIEYELQGVGPWGVGQVEFWATPDDGRSWTSLGVDHDGRSPFLATMPGAGTYGFLIVVAAANCAPAAPRAGDRPEMLVGVDLEPPRATIDGVQTGAGALADSLIIRWTAVDEHLAQAPVSLFFTASPDGPWTTIAADLPNTGEYRWRLTRQPPRLMYLKLEVRDLAGNVGQFQTPKPVDVAVPSPTGRLRSVRPVTSEPGRYRTADGRP